MTQCPDEIKRLIDRFNQQSDHVRSPDYNETLILIDYVNPMTKALGWDIDNNQGFAEQYREAVHEDRVKVAGQTKAPDYSFPCLPAKFRHIEVSIRGMHAVQETQVPLVCATAYVGEARDPSQLLDCVFFDPWQ
ncbi:MAG: hypothetical protein WD768_16840 [Phycisphaeraceae bacterium]